MPLETLRPKSAGQNPTCSETVGITNEIKSSLTKKILSSIGLELAEYVRKHRTRHSPSLIWPPIVIVKNF